MILLRLLELLSQLYRLVSVMKMRESDYDSSIRSILRPDGYEVEMRANGREAIAYLQEHAPPSLVIVDVMMPYVTGYEVVRFLKKTTPLADVPGRPDERDGSGDEAGGLRVGRVPAPRSAGRRRALDPS